MRLDPRLLRRGLAGALVVLLAFDLLVLLAGESPWDALVRALAGTWGTRYGIGQVLYKATLLLFSGAAFDVALRAGLFNIGTEAQIATGALVAGLVGARLPAGTPVVVGAVVVLLCAAGAGAAWGAGLGVLRSRFDAHEVITSVLLNRIVDALVPLAFTLGWGVSSVRTGEIVEGARLPRLTALFPASAASVAFPAAVAVAFGWVAFARRTRTGRSLAWVGEGPRACEAEGLPVARLQTLALALSGGIAGLVAMPTVLGYKGHYELGMTTGAGFAGLAVAFLGRGSALGMVLAALFLGTLGQAGLVLNATVPRDMVDVLLGVTILAVAIASRRDEEAYA